MSPLSHIALTGIALAAMGCATTGGEAVPFVDPMPLGGGLTGPRPASAPPSGPAKARAAAAPTGPLTLRDMYRLALEHNPGLAASAREVRALQAEQGQAGAVPNPELSVELEDWLGSGAMEGIQSLQVTVGLSQKVELGGKRSARQEAAGAARQVAAWNHELRRLEVLGQVSRGFVQVLAAQRVLTMASKLEGLALEAARVFVQQEAEGRLAPLARSRGEVAASLATLAVSDARRDLRRRRLALATVWGAGDATFGEVKGTLELPGNVPPLAGLMPNLSRSPLLRRHKAARARLAAAVQGARADAWPDLTVGAGYRYMNAPGDSALVVGLGLPLPLLDRNQGAARAARHRAAAGDVEAAAARQQLTSTLRQLHTDLAAAHAQAVTLEQSVLVQARKTHQAILAGQALGRFGYLDLLAAQRDRFEVERRLIQALARYHLTAVQLEQLLGVPILARSSGAGQADGAPKGDR